MKMEQIKRERKTESEVRALDAGDIVVWIHRLEDEISGLNRKIARIEMIQADMDQSTDWACRLEEALVDQS